MDRALHAEKLGQTERFTRLYAICLETIEETLKLHVPSMPEEKASKIKSELLNWKAEVQRRCVCCPQALVDLGDIYIVTCG